MVYKVVLTGGPGSGKTSVKDGIIKHFSVQGYQVLFVSETASELINGGVKCFGNNSLNVVDFQEYVMKLQLLKEQIYIDAASKLGGDVIVIYDRGTIDNFAYMSEDEGHEIINRVLEGKTKVDLLNNYDLVIVLQSSKDFYTTENNKARSEDVNEALELGKRTLNSWVGHKKLKIVGPKDTLHEKINEVLNLINELLEKTQVKRQEKYLISLRESDIDKVIDISRVQQIKQTYLLSDDKTEKRLRQVIFDNDVSYYYSVFKLLEDGSKIIVSEKKISEEEYNNLLEFKDENLKDIKKIRYYFTDDLEYFNLDIFDDNSEYGLLEINTQSEVRIPKYLKVIENVTNNQDYSNRFLAREIGIKREFKI